MLHSKSTPLALALALFALSLFVSFVVSPVHAQAIRYGTPPAAEETPPATESAKPGSSFTFKVIEEDSFDKDGYYFWEGSEHTAPAIIEEHLKPETKALDIEEKLIGPMQSGVSDYVIREIDDKSLKVLQQMLKDSARAETILRAQLSVGTANEKVLNLIEKDLSRLHRHKMAITARLGKLHEVDDDKHQTLIIGNDGLPTSSWVLIIAAAIGLGLVGRQLYGKVKPSISRWNENRLKIKDAKLRQKLSNLSPDEKDEEGDEQSSGQPTKRKRQRRSPRKQQQETSSGSDEAQEETSSGSGEDQGETSSAKTKQTKGTGSSKKEK